jgi:hypothetical protein
MKNVMMIVDDTRNFQNLLEQRLLEMLQDSR